jgi:hypothetical protein
MYISVYCNISSFGSSSMLAQGVWAGVNGDNEHLRLVSQQSALEVQDQELRRCLAAVL